MRLDCLLSFKEVFFFFLFEEFDFFLIEKIEFLLLEKIKKFFFVFWLELMFKFNSFWRMKSR